MVERFTVSREDDIYEAFPDVALTGDGRLVCAFLECTHHGDRPYSRLVAVSSGDRGRTWSAKRPLSEPLYGGDSGELSWNCPRILALSDGRLLVAADRTGPASGPDADRTGTYLWHSEDGGDSWAGPRATPVEGIVPDVVELRRGDHRGRWLVGAHVAGDGAGEGGTWRVRYWRTDDRGQTWAGPATVAADPDYQLCEGSVVELPGGELACLMRENSLRGLDAFVATSADGGESWDGHWRLPTGGCHRPTAGVLDSGAVLVTYRHQHGGLNPRAQNAFAALTTPESLLAGAREDAHVRILPLDHDSHPAADTGYTGWVQFGDGEIYVVNYLVDDAPTATAREPAGYDGEYAEAARAYIAGYSLREEEFLSMPIEEFVRASDDPGPP